MPSSGMLRCVALVRTGVSEERMLVVTAKVPSSPNLVSLMMEAILFSEMLVLT
jgi:hypothetical protein